MTKATATTPVATTASTSPKKGGLRLAARIGVCRLTSDAGWHAGIQRQLQKREKNFADSTHGGREACFKVACQWRAQQEREMPEAWSNGSIPDPIGTLVIARTLRPRWGADGYCTGFVDVLVARLKTDSGWATTTVSVDAHGFEEAQRRCVAWAQTRKPKPPNRLRAPRAPRGRKKSEREQRRERRERYGRAA